MKNVIFVGGIFNDNLNNAYLEHSKNTTNFAANSYFNKLINAYKQIDSKVYVFSSPFMGNYKRDTFDKNNDFFVSDSTFFYGKCSTNRFARLFQLKHALTSAFKNNKGIINNNLDTYVFITQPSLLYLKAAFSISRSFKKVKILLFVPDVTLFSNLEQKSYFLKLLKIIEHKAITKMLKKVNGFVLFAKKMLEFLPANSHYIVVEGISSDFNARKSDDEKTILYTGTLNYAFGIKDFVDVFLEKAPPNIVLKIAGSGEAAEDFKKIRSDNFKYLGSISPSDCIKEQNKATVLFNPRKPDSLYTKFSFPSKTMEYLCNNGVVACFKLEGIPDEYDDYLFYPDEPDLQTLVEKCIDLCNVDKGYFDKHFTDLKGFLKNKGAKSAVDKIESLLKRV